MFFYLRKKRIRLDWREEHLFEYAFAILCSSNSEDPHKNTFNEI
jgi:hypothetical protein